MTALCDRAGNYIFIMWFLFFFLLSFFFLAYSQRSHIGCLPYFYTWRDPCANLECRFEMCCMHLAGNTGPKIAKKIRHLGIIAQFCQAISSQLRHVSTIGKNLLGQQYLLHMYVPNSHNIVNFGPLAAEIGPVVSGRHTPANFNGFRVLHAAFLHGTLVVGINQTFRR